MEVALMRKRIAIAAALVLLALAAAHAQSFGDGTHVVGLDIQPGIYRAPGGDTCIWQRLSGLSGEYQDIIASGLLATKPTVEIQATDKAFMATNCGAWLPLGGTTVAVLLTQRSMSRRRPVSW